MDKLRLLPNSTNAEMAQLLGWPINCVTPRVTELRKPENGALVLDAGMDGLTFGGLPVYFWAGFGEGKDEAFQSFSSEGASSRRLSR